MAGELVIPAVGESITEVLIAAWHKRLGETVTADETIAELESDKATLELPAPIDGVLVRVLKQQGETAQVGEVIGYIEAADGVPAMVDDIAIELPVTPVMPTAPMPAEPPGAVATVMPAAARLMAEKGISPGMLTGSGRGGAILKEDVLKLAVERPVVPQPEELESAAAAPAVVLPVPDRELPVEEAPSHAGAEQVVPMSPIRKRIAERLLQSQSQMALLTTFNEIDMSAVIGLRKAYQQQFMERYQIKLGLMSFFIKAAIEALKAVPQVNAEIRGTDIVYKNYYDIGIAVGSGKGLVVPVIRNADQLSFAGLEQKIADFSERAKANRIDLAELKGGTFTISNGGVYGSLLSTPIVNPPQSGVLGLHAIQDRAIVRDGQIVARPMMYLALTYDHRIIDGRESVMFLKRIKELIEDPARLLLEV